MERIIGPRGKPDDTVDAVVVETEVETVGITAAPADARPPSQAIVSDRTVGYFETLPERLSALGFVARAAILGLLGIRFLLHASGANTASDFAGFIERLSWLFAWPFANVFGNRSLGPGVIEPSTLVAIVVYLLMFALLGRLYTALAPRVSGAGGRRARLTFWAPSRLSPATLLPAALEHRRVLHPTAPADHLRKHRRLRVVRARKS